MCCVGLCRGCVGSVELCGAWGADPSRPSGTAFTFLAGGRLQSLELRCSNNSPFTPSIPPAGKLWRVSVPGHGAPTPAAAKAGTLLLIGLSNICTIDDLSHAGKERPPSRIPRTNVLSREPPEVASRECVRQLLGLVPAHHQDLQLSHRER